MITDGFLNLVLTIVTWIISWFPAYTGLPSGMTSSMSWITSKVGGVGCILPTDTYVTQFLIIIAVAAGLLMFRFFAWLFKWKPRDHA